MNVLSREKKRTCVAGLFDHDCSLKCDASYCGQWGCLVEFVQVKCILCWTWLFSDLRSDRLTLSSALFWIRSLHRKNNYAGKVQWGLTVISGVTWLLLTQIMITVASWKYWLFPLMMWSTGLFTGFFRDLIPWLRQKQTFRCYLIHKCLKKLI